MSHARRKAPAVAAKREARIIAGEAALAAGSYEPRDPGAALLSAASDADAVVQRLKTDLAAGIVIDGATLAVLGEWLDRVSRLSKVVVDARIAERQAALEEAQARMVVLAFHAALDALDATAAQRDLAARVLVADLRRQEGRVGWGSAGDRGGPPVTSQRLLGAHVRGVSAFVTARVMERHAGAYLASLAYQGVSPAELAEVKSTIADIRAAGRL